MYYTYRKTMEKTDTDVEKMARAAIRFLGIPKQLQADAIQEAWVAHLEGKNIRTHLFSWYRKERKWSKGRVELLEDTARRGPE
jgi:hypothetical protein